MQATLYRSSITGKAATPASKSYTIRALMGAALAEGTSFIRNPLKSDDTLAAVNVLTNTGVSVTENKSDWVVAGGRLSESAQELYCRESAATLRFMAAVAALIPGDTRLTYGPGLARRPIRPLLDALEHLGAAIRQEDNAIVITGGRLEGGSVCIQGDQSSQYISALMLIGPCLSKGLIINLSAPPRSKPYILMTRECMRHYGVHVAVSSDLTKIQISPQKYNPALYQVEGDWSQASYLLALGALSGGVLVTNLNAESLQGDRIILNILQKMGARFSQRGGSVMISKSTLRSIKVDLSDAIDLLPVVAVLAATAEGETEISGVSRARLKESNRVGALKNELGKLGVIVIEEEDKINIIGGNPHGGVVDSYADHRLAMAFAVIGSHIGNTTVLQAESVSKTFPDFWRVFQSLGGQVKMNG
jgi:3-phosphoshikimate 1-carboxyvinyltransferase